MERTTEQQNEVNYELTNKITRFFFIVFQWINKKELNDTPNNENTRKQGNIRAESEKRNKHFKKRFFGRKSYRANEWRRKKIFIYVNFVVLKKLGLRGLQLFAPIKKFLYFLSKINIKYILLAEKRTNKVHLRKAIRRKLLYKKRVFAFKRKGSWIKSKAYQRYLHMCLRRFKWRNTWNTKCRFFTSYVKEKKTHVSIIARATICVFYRCFENKMISLW